MSKYLTAALLALLLAGCTSGDAKAPPAAITESFAVATSSGNRCERPRAFLEVGHRSALVPFDRSTPLSLTVRVGDTIHLRATGNCAASVSASPQNKTLKRAKPGSSTTFQAVTPGVVDLEITMPACARPPTYTQPPCAGGLGLLGDAVITIQL